MTMAAILWLQGRLVLPGGICPEGLVEVVGGRIEGVWDLGASHGPDAYHAARIRGDLPAGGGRLTVDGQEVELVEAGDGYICPGFLDVHVHGGGGADFMDADPEAVLTICRFHAAHGTAALLATTLTAAPAEIVAALAAVRRAAVWTGRTGGAPAAAGAAVLGFHVEGPFINPEYKGAQDEGHLRLPATAEADSWLAAGGPATAAVWQVTMAPELPGGLAFIRHVTERGMLVNAGHTGCRYAEMAAAVGAGLTGVTHAFNAMRGLHHREPGCVGAAMALPHLRVELIADGHHVHPASMGILIRARGAGEVHLVTDAMRAAGQPEGTYGLGGLTVTVRAGRALLADGTLAGSLLTMDQAVANIHRLVGLPLHTAVHMASLNPARRLGLDGRKGSLAAGKDADITILDRHLQASLTLAGGRVIWDGR